MRTLSPVAMLRLPRKTPAVKHFTVSDDGSGCLRAAVILRIIKDTMSLRMSAAASASISSSRDTNGIRVIQ